MPKRITSLSIALALLAGIGLSTIAISNAVAEDTPSKPCSCCKACQCDKPCECGH